MDQRFNGDNPSRRHWAQAQAALTTKIATSGVTVRIARPRCCHGRNLRAASGQHASRVTLPPAGAADRRVLLSNLPEVPQAGRSKGRHVLTPSALATTEKRHPIRGRSPPCHCTPSDTPNDAHLPNDTALDERCYRGLTAGRLHTHHWD